ncbi:hypothetical protein D9613_000760 [Agrocybe pediades]|uniref:Uncharacterized protein n=1 Tax=Agrocybe pediades TaxID=84607 RepID=A0A8H4VS16_9AGAR|nr:hypothetical protein D9613_000760 [Agrocybe pediades]
MDGSDDYIIDDIVLDDQTLAALDQAEQKYQSSLSQSQFAALPAIKRQKTNNGWKPGASVNPTLDDDLPEISLQRDGSYGIGPKSTAVSNEVFIPGFPPRKPVISSNVASNRPPNVVNHRPVYQQQRSNAHASGSRPPNHRQTSTNGLVLQRQLLPNGHQSQIANNNGGATFELHAQMSELQKKMEELREENARMQAALKEATSAKLAKEGEVSILRKTIERTAQTHALQLQQLKSDKELAEKKQVQIQKDMKAELERLRTQNMFKQQEIEAATRKVPVSVRPKKTQKDYPSTPMTLPPEMAGWNKDRLSQMGTPNAGSPVRKSRPNRPNQFAEDSPAPKSSPLVPKKKLTMPGFESAFTSTPTRSPSKRDKGKMKAHARFESDNTFFETDNSMSPLFNRHSRGLPGPSTLHRQRSTHEEHQVLDMVVDQSQATGVIDVQPQPTEDPPPTLAHDKDEDVVIEEIEVFDPINWKAELCRVLLTHSYNSYNHTSFQQLLSSSQFVDTSNNYSRYCSRIMEVIAHSTNNDTPTNLSSDFYGLAEKAHIVPAFFPCHSPIVKLHKKRWRKKPHDEQADVAKELASLLEILCFRLSRELAEKFEVLLRNRDVLLRLLHAKQPVWFLERTSRILVFLSTHHSLCKTLLGIPETAAGSTGRPVKDKFTEKLCSHLLDTSKPADEEFKLNILAFFAQLSVAHPDAFTTLVASPMLIPALVSYISLLSTPLWEDDPAIVSSTEASAKLLQAIAQSIVLLHYFVFGRNPCLNLHQKLQSTPSRLFNGLDHVFVVTLGRLAYIDPPSWMDETCRQELQYICDVARGILEVVFDGPEGDSVWAAFQQESDEDSAMEEDEMEARLLGGGP